MSKLLQYLVNKPSVQHKVLPGLRKMQMAGQYNAERDATSVNTPVLSKMFGGQFDANHFKLKKQGGPVVDPRGQWAHPGKVTRIPGSDITMQGVPYPVLGVGSNGKEQMMYPGQDYDFGGASYVDEYPMMQFGGGPLLGPMISMMPKMAPTIINMFSGDPLKKFIKWVNEPSEATASTSRPSPLPVEEPVRTYGYYDTHSEYSDRANDVYSQLKNNDRKEYNSPKQITLSSGRFRGAKVDPEMINDIVKVAKDNDIDPWVMLSLVGRESTFGSGAVGNKLRAGDKQSLVSGWNVAEEYMPYEFSRFLADKKVPGIEVHKDNHGWQYLVKDKEAIDDYLKKNPKLIDSYYKKLESTPNLGKLDSFTLAAQRIKKKGIQNYNPGDPKYPSMVNADMNLLKQDAELKAYMKSKGYRDGGMIKMQNGGQMRSGNDFDDRIFNPLVKGIAGLMDDAGEMTNSALQKITDLQKLTAYTALPTYAAKAHGKVNRWLFNNIRPVEYPGVISGIKNISMGLLNQNAPPQKDSKGLYDIGEEAWQKALGKTQQPMQSHYIIPSKYKPGDAKDPNAKYYTLKEGVIDPQLLIEEVKRRNLKDNEVAFMPSLAPFIREGFMPEHEFSQIDPLQKFKLMKGSDDKGNFVSIYDKYDFAGPLNSLIVPYEFYDRYYYKKNGGQHGGLDRWFAEKWVDVKTGKACGRQEGEKRAGYPACRPSKRVSSETPKTSSEMSSAEKAKFKANKTSSQRINYNHKRNK